MNLVDIVLLLVILVIVGLAVAYIIKEKKKGTKCIGCPVAGNCSSYKSHQGCGCHTDTKE